MYRELLQWVDDEGLEHAVEIFSEFLADLGRSWQILADLGRCLCMSLYVVLYMVVLYTVLLHIVALSLCHCLCPCIW